MIRKINITLGILCLCGALFIGGVIFYCKKADPANSKAAQQVEVNI